MQEKSSPDNLAFTVALNLDLAVNFLNVSAFIESIRIGELEEISNIYSDYIC